MLNVSEIERARLNETRYDDEESNMPQPEQYDSPYMSSHSSTDDLEIHELKHQAALERAQWRLRGSYLSAAYAWKKTRCFLILSIIMIFLTLAALSWSRRQLDTRQPVSESTTASPPKWVKPTGFRIVALVFYGRPATVSVLDCYLKKNLVDNGGYLDEVLWLARTESDHDLGYLQALMNTTKRYTTVTFGEKKPTFHKMWERATDANTLYIKIDDDMVCGLSYLQ